MYIVSMENTLSTDKAAKLLGVSVKTLQRWEREGRRAHHDRDPNAAVNLERLATVTALPVARPSGNGGAASERVSGVVGKVTPVRYEHGHRDGSGQEENRAHFCALSWEQNIND